MKKNMKLKILVILISTLGFQQVTMHNSCKQEELKSYWHKTSSTTQQKLVPPPINKCTMHVKKTYEDKKQYFIYLFLIKKVDLF